MQPAIVTISIRPATVRNEPADVNAERNFRHLCVNLVRTVTLAIRIVEHASAI